MGTDELDSLLRGVALAPALRPPPRVGERLGNRYLIEAVVGEGGMGSVYRALDEKLGEQVALKILKGALDDSILRDEVRLAQKVTHPNVCRTFDLEDVDGRQILKMEYIAGDTLAKCLTGGPLAVADALRIARAIASGLAAAHAMNIVHSDLKPANVMLEGDRVVVMDFGGAHNAAMPNEHMQGTLGYIAPEKLRHHSGDERSDDYALGCVLYEMLTGEPVFVGSPIALAALHVGEPPPDVRAKRSEVPRWLARVVTKLLSKEPADRSAGIRRLMVGPRSPARLGLVAAVGMVALVLAVWWYRSHEPWSPTTWKPERDTDENLSRIDISPDNRWLVFDSDRAPEDRSTSGSKLYVMSLETRTATQLDLTGDELADPRFTKGGTELIYYADDATWAQPIAGTPPRAVGRRRMLFRGIHANPCGDGYVFNRIHSNGHWMLWSVDARGTEKMLLDGEGQSVGEGRCDRAGRRVLVARGELDGNDAFIIDRVTGDAVRVTHDRHLSGAGAFSRDERSIIVSRPANNETSQLFELPLDGGPARQITFGELSSTLPTISQDGTHLVYTHDGTWFPPALGRATMRKLTSEKSFYFFNRPFDRDRIVTERSKGGHSEIELLSITTGQPTPLAEGRRPFGSIGHDAVYFTDPVDPHYLDRVMVATKTVSHVAWLPGEPFCGEDGPDGVHVAVSIGDQKFGYRIAEGGPIYEHVQGLVTLAPRGGWRAVTVYGVTTNHVSLVSPGGSPDRPARSFDVQSTYNRWLDDHTLAYCADKCVELDVTTGMVATIGEGHFLATETDDHQILQFHFEPGQASMRVITNFGDR